MNLILPWWAKWASLTVLVLSSYVGGRVQQYYQDDKTHAVELAKVKAIADMHKAKVEQIDASNKEATERISDDYAKNIVALRKYYESRRLSDYANSNRLPKIPGTAQGADAGTADCIPASAVEQLARDSAETTLQLKALQEWVSSIKSGTTPF